MLHVNQIVHVHFTPGNKERCVHPKIWCQLPIEAPANVIILTQVYKYESLQPIVVWSFQGNKRSSQGVNWQQTPGTVVLVASLTIEVDSITLCPSHPSIDVVVSRVLLETKDRHLV